MNSATKDQLKHVRQVVASDGAFAAIRRDGSVVTWGNPGQGSDSKAVQEELRNVRHINPNP